MSGCHFLGLPALKVPVKVLLKGTMGTFDDDENLTLLLHIGSWQAAIIVLFVLTEDRRGLSSHYIPS